MRYIFKVLILSFNSEFLSGYISQVDLEEGEDKNNYIDWYKELNVFESTCDLEIDTIIDIVHADYDELIPSADGIIYFLNPLIQEELEFFEITMPIIKSIKRSIPIIIVYINDKNHLTSSANNLLENLWTQYPDLEGFVNLLPSRFNQALQCLCSSMISGDTPLNIENARMRFPIFINLAKIYFKIAMKGQKPKYYYYTAQAIKKAALIADTLKSKKFKKKITKLEKILKINFLYHKLIKKLKKRLSKLKKSIKKKNKRNIKKNE